MVDSILSTKLQSEAFFAHAAATDDRLELIDGEIIVNNSSNLRHQVVLGNLLWLLKRLIAGGTTVLGPLDIRLDDENVVQPDLLWIAPDGKAKITEARIEGAPDLVVEILSAATLRRDKTVKFLLYEKFGVREYWMIDPAGMLEAWALQGKEFALISTVKAGETFASPLLNVSLDMTPLFQIP